MTRRLAFWTVLTLIAFGVGLGIGALLERAKPLIAPGSPTAAPYTPPIIAPEVPPQYHYPYPSDYRPPLQWQHYYQPPPPDDSLCTLVEGTVAEPGSWCEYTHPVTRETYIVAKPEQV